MPKVSSDYIPTSIHHRASEQAVVRLCGKDHYLGPWNSPQAKANYEKLIAEWLSHGRQLPAPRIELTVNEMILAYWKRCQIHYRKPNGETTSELNLVRLACRPVKNLYGHTDACTFGPLSLKACRQEMVRSGLSRGVTNAHVGRIKRMFRWAVSEELIAPTVYQALATVTGLQIGRTEAKELPPIRPVSEAFIDAVKSFVSPQVQAMIEIQTLTACRPGEVCMMRGMDLEMSGRVWGYRPDSHKTQHHGHAREIYIGPLAQDVIRPWLRSNISEFLFSAAEAESTRNQQRRQNRKTPMTPSQRRRKPKADSERARGDCYTSASYARAIRNACRLAKVPVWGPNRLRHTAATNLRREHGVELARIVLGHSTAFTTEIYAEVDRNKAIDVMGRVG